MTRRNKMIFQSQRAMFTPATVVLPFAALLVSTQVAAQSQWAPTKTVRVVVPFAAGGTIDILGRLLSQPLSRPLGQKVGVVHRPGGGALLALPIFAPPPAAWRPGVPVWASV